MTGSVVGVGMPDVIWLSGGIVVPTGVVGTGEAEPEEVETAAEADDEADEAEEDTDGDEDEDEEAEADCLFARRAWRSLAATAARRAKRATSLVKCMETSGRRTRSV